MLNIAVIGCGAIADSHAWAIQHLKGCRLAAACDAEPLMATQFAERFGVERTFTDVDTLLRDAKPDVVHIATPPQSHYALTKKCLEHGCHAYVEKPFTLLQWQTDELLALAESRKLKVTVGHDLLYSQATVEMREMIKQGYLGGNPIHMESHYGYEFSTNYGDALLTDKNHWVRKLPGKLLHNIISHGIARIAEYLSGNEPAVMADGFTSAALRQLGENEIIDELRVMIRDEKGVTAYFTFSSQMRPTLNQFAVYGPKNGLQINETQQTVVRLQGKRYKSYAEKFVPSLQFSAQHLKSFFHKLSLFAKNDFHVELGKVLISDALYKSITTGGELPIPYEKIRLTGWIMEEIFRQLNRQAAARADQPAPVAARALPLPIAAEVRA